MVSLRVVVVAGSVLVAGCSVEVMQDLDESEANAILAALHANGISAEKGRFARGSTATYSVTVDRDDAVKAWQVLRQEQLPRPKHSGFSQLFDKIGLIPTTAQQHALVRQALAGELSETLQSVGGVLQARVHVVAPQREPLAPPDSPRPQPRASVMLRTKGKVGITADEVKKIVAGAVHRMRPDQVTVVFVPAEGQRRQTPATGTAPEVTQVGPFTVATGSRGRLSATLLAGLTLLVALGLTTLFALRRAAALGGRLKQISRSAADSPVEERGVEASLGLLERSLARGGPSGRSIAAGKDSSGSSSPSR